MMGVALTAITGYFGGTPGMIAGWVCMAIVAAVLSPDDPPGNNPNLARDSQPNPQPGA